MGERSAKLAAMEKFELGVLLVHGIGTQPPRDTLVRWGDALLNVIRRATMTQGLEDRAIENQVVLTVRQASAGDRSGENPAEVAVTIRYGSQTERWLLAEGWWADCFPTPTYSELVSWSVRALPWSIALHIAQRYWQADPNASRTRELWAGAKAVLKLLGAMALAPLFIALLALVLVLGLLPIPQLRSLILSAQTTLIGTVGDSLAFVESPIRAALIRNRILEGLERLKERCARTVIVAHSQGAAAVFDALGGIPQAPPDDKKSTNPPPEGPVPDTLVTFGSGVNQLASLRFLSAGPPEKTAETNPPYVAVGAIVAIIVVLGYLYVSIRSGSSTVWNLGEAAGVWSGVILGSALLIWSADRTIDTLTAQGWLAALEQGAREKRRAFVILPVLLAALAFALFYFLVLRRDLPMFPVIILYLALILLAASLVMILVSSTKDMVANSVEKPQGLTRWVDLYASADPVPNGPTMLPAAGAPESVLIWNRGAMLSDHTTYWDNLDGFVLRVARVCAETAKSPWLRKLPDATQMSFTDQLAKWRVGFLRWAVGINTLFWLLALSLLWWRHEARVPLPFDLPAWLPAWAPMAARAAALALMIAVGAWATAALLRWPWSHWVRAEQELMLARRNPSDTVWASWALICMGVVIGLLVFLAWQLAHGSESEMEELLAARWDKLLTGMMIGVFSFVVIAFWRRPQPDRRTGQQTAP